MEPPTATRHGMMNMRAIGSYRVLRPLGAGGMGEVLLGFDDRLERPVALKRVRGGGSERHRRLRREAQLVARLSHTNIVQVHDLVDTDDGVVVVMEFIEGRTVDALLQDGPLEVDQTIDLGRQIARGLTAAHAAGLVHRDLKAANIMVTADGVAKVLDFGIAKSLADDRMTATGAVIGTYRAMSPEQALGREIDARSDLFALGALLYEMLSGTSPFAAATPLATLRRVTETAPPPLMALRPDAPAALIELIEALLAKDPQARPPGARYVAHALDNLLAETTRPEPPTRATFGDCATTVDNPSVAHGSRAPSRDRASAPDTARAASRSPPWPWRRGPSRVAAVVVVLVILAILASLWQARTRPALRVLLLPPLIEGPNDDPRGDPRGDPDGARQGDPYDTGFIAAGYAAAGVRALTQLKNLRVIDPAEVRGLEGTPVELAHAVAADETLQASLRLEGTTAFLTLSRATADGTIHWTNTFQVPTAPEDALILAAAVASEIGRAFDEHGEAEDAPNLSVSSADYAAFLRIKRGLELGTVHTLDGIGQLESLIESSPRFVDAYIVATSAYITDFLSRDHLPSLERSARLLEAVEDLAPTNPNVLELQIRIAVVRGDSRASHEAASRFEKRFPGDPLVQSIRAQIAEREGRLDDALVLRHEAAQRMPSWRNLWWLANVSRRAGEITTARESLEALLSRSPNNFWGLLELGQLELLNGDLERASHLFRQLIQRHPRRSLFTNLGLAEFLSGDYSAAIESFRQALLLSPGHLTVLLNLADAHSALEEHGKALDLYREVLEQLDAKAQNVPLEPNELTKRAQALARLGENDAAVECILQALQSNRKDGEIAFQASLVYALVGENASALAAARRAREMGIQPRWFMFPAFETLRIESAFKELLDLDQEPLG